MTTYLLHGGMLKVETASNTEYFKRIASAVPQGGKVLVVLFAADESRWPELFEMMKGYIGLTGRVDIICIQASVSNFINEIKDADAILIRGGDTDRLLSILRRYPELPQALKGKLIAGSSAGAYVLGSYNYSRKQNSIRTGLGFLPVRVLCHYKSSDPNEYNGDEAVAVMESAHTELPLIVLKDCEWKEFSL